MASVPDTRRATRDPGLEELRGPLESIVAYLDFLLEQEVSEQERRRFLEVARGSALRAQRLVAEHEQR
jgi:signal transduction histidine kinase